MSKRKHIRLCAAFALILAAAAAARAQYRVDSWTTDDGLPQNSVNDVRQTRDGYVWLTTNDGLVRFDGIRFTVFNRANTPHLGTNRLRKLFEDDSGRLWFSGEDDSFGFYAGGKFTPVARENELKLRPRHRFVDDGAGGILLTTANFAHLQYRDGKLQPLDLTPARPESELLLRDRDGWFWLASREGVYRQRGNETRSYDLPVKKIETADDFSAPAVYQDRAGAIWLGYTDDGLFRIKGDRLVKYALPRTLFQSIGEDVRGNLWIGTGTIRIDAAAVEAEEAVPSAVTTFKIDDSELNGGAVCADSEAGVFVGGTTGLHRISPRTVRVFSKKDGLPEDNIYPIRQMRDGRIRFGAWNNHLLEYDGERFSSFLKTLSYPYVTALYEAPDGRFWFGTQDYVFYLDGKTPVNYAQRLGLNAPTEFHLIEQAANGDFWFGTSRGAIRHNNGETRIFTVADGLPDDFVTAFLERKNGEIWLGTRGGVARFDGGGAFGSVTTKNGLASDYVRALYEDADETLWIGTYDGGLSRLKNGAITNYTTAQGLHSNGVFVILEDDNGWFWFNSNQGIYRVRKQDLNDYADGRIKFLTSVAYNKADGLLNVEGNGGAQPAGIRAGDGRLWFPTAEGAAVIDPNEIQINRRPPPILIEAISIDRQPVTPDGNGAITIEPRAGNLEIEYTGLSFVASSQVKFRYRLDGFETDWNEVGTRRTAYYSYLPPGEYTFRVVGANRDGVWNEAGARLKIVVLPPFYRTWWFFAAAAFAIGATIFAAFKIRLNQVERRRAAQQEFSRRLIVAHEQERRRVAAELHDSIGQTLAMIKNRAVFGAGVTGETAAKEQLQAITQQTAQAIGEVREISYNLRPYLLENLGLEKALQSLVAKIEEVHLLEIRARIGAVDNLFGAEAEISVYRIVQESLNNVAKHAEADSATLSLEASKDFVTIIIADDGRGFDKNAAPNKSSHADGGFGLLGITERVRMLNGSLDIETAPGAGTRLTIKIPITNEQTRNG